MFDVGIFILGLSLGAFLGAIVMSVLIVSSETTVNVERKRPWERAP